MSWILILTLVFEGTAIHTVEFKFKDDCIKAKQSYEQMFTKQKVYRPTLEAICVEKRSVVAEEIE